MEEKRNSESNVCLSESLTKTHAFTTHERREAQRISRLAFGSKGPFVVSCLDVESRRHVEVRFWPLNRVVMNGLKVDTEAISFFYNNFFTLSNTHLKIDRGFLENALSRRWFYSQNFVIALL